MRIFLLAVLLFAALPGRAQFALQDSHSTASLRGIDSVGNEVAWASGSAGTVRRTEDGGAHWQLCAVPPGATQLDFRAIQALDAQTALAMSSGKGPLSRLYRTTDGCRSWTLLLTNPDPEGFWDGLRLDRRSHRAILWGDPVPSKDTRFVLYQTFDLGQHWTRSKVPSLQAAAPGIGGFAASNSTLSAEPLAFATGGPYGPFFYSADPAATCTTDLTRTDPAACLRDLVQWHSVKVPMAGATATSGIFSFARHGETLVAVGGDFTQPTARTGTAARNQGVGWVAAEVLPGGYRSAVAFDEQTQTWLTVGPTGADLSLDDGQTWQPLPGPNATGWNAISLPFVAGSKGRIARIEPRALNPKQP